MSKPEDFYRTSIAVPTRHKPKLDERLKQLGVRSAGELVNVFIHEEGVLEALKPFVAAYQARAAAQKASIHERRAAMESLKDMTPEQIKKLLAMVPVNM